MATLAPYTFQQYFDDDGAPLNAGTVTAYTAGTTDKKDIYSAADGVTALSNPFTLASDGRTTFFLGEGTYDFLIKDSAGNTLDTKDDVSGTGGGGASLQTVATIAALKALASGSSDYVIVSAYYAAGDKGGGTYRWNSTSTTADDGGITIQPDSTPATGRWLLENDGRVTSKQYGAKGDGSTDDQAALNNANNATILVMVPGFYKIASALAITTDIEFKQGAYLTAASAIVCEFGARFDAPDDVVFAGSIVPSFLEGATGVIKASWWGILLESFVGAFNQSANTTDIHAANQAIVNETSLWGEQLTNVVFSAGWSGADDLAVSGDNAVYTYSGGTGTMGTTAFVDSGSVSKQANKYYLFEYDIVSPSGDVQFLIKGGDTFFALNDVYLDMTAGADKKVFFQADDGALTTFRIDGTATSGAATISNPSLKEVQGGNQYLSGVLSGGGTSGIRFCGDGTINISANRINYGTDRTAAGCNKGLYFDSSDNVNITEALTVTGVITGTGGVVVQVATTSSVTTEGALWLDSDAGANGTLKCYSNSGWRTVTAF